MAASLVSIWNLALVPLGAERVMDPLEDTESARKCNAVWEQIRDDEMSSHPWNFATTRIQLALSTTTPTYDYSYAHQLPSDALRILELEGLEDYKVEGDKVLSNQSIVKCRYIKLITDPLSYSSQFVSLVAARLQFELAYSLTDSSTAMERLFAVYEKKKKIAKAVDAQEGTPVNAIGDRWIDARSGVVH